MAIISPLTYTITNGQAVDATPLMADLNQIVSNVNTNAAALAGSSAQTFNVANATTSGQAASLGQVQAGSANYAVDSGAANAYVITLTPPPAAITPGMIVGISAIIAANTGAATLNVNGLGALPIHGAAGAALQGGELVAAGNAILRANANATAWDLVWTTGALPVASGAYSNQAVALGQFVESHGTSGYEKLPGGRIRQWAAGSIATANTNQVVTLPISFTTAIDFALSASSSPGSFTTTSINGSSLSTILVSVSNANAYYFVVVEGY